MMKNITQALDDYSYRGFIFRRTAQSRLIYLFRWAMTAFVCYLFYSVIALSAMAGLLLTLNLIIRLWE